MIRKFVTVCALAAFVLATASCQKLQARDQLVKGIKAFKENRYDRAAEYFDKAHQLDPDLENAQLYLATAYAQQFDPSQPPVPGSDNEKFAKQAIATFESVLEKDPKNANAIAGLAGLYQGLKDLNKSRDYYRKQTEIEPDNPVPYYAIASTNWLRIRDKSVPLTDEEKAQAVEEGLEYVDKALEKNPNYQEALAYKNLLLRDKAAAAKDPAEAKRYLEEADVYFQKALAARNQPAAAGEQKAAEGEQK
jgi:tetratricopeptide (TPR) repeat protein